MHGVIQPVGIDVRHGRAGPGARLWQWVVGHRWFLGLVVLPTVIVAFYYFAIASDQYQAETHFVVRAAEEQKPAAAGGISQIIAAAGGGGGGGENSSPGAMSVADYLTSHEIVAALRKQIGLVARYRRPDIDLLSRLRWENPSDEDLLKYYLNQTKIEINTATGITVVRVRAFTPQDALIIANALLDLGDKRVNSLNAGADNDTIAAQERQLRSAEADLEKAQADISRFRAVRGDINPEGTGMAQTSLISSLTASLATARAQLQSVGATLSHGSPQYIALQRQVAALQAQVAAQSARLAGSGTTIASQLATYNELQLRQQFASTRYASVQAGLDRAREQTQRKQLYLVRVVNPALPGKSEYPQRGRTVGTIFLALFVAYGIGWLIIAGVREHEA